MRKPIAWTLAAVAAIAVLVTAAVVGGKMLSAARPSAVSAECTVPVPASLSTAGVRQTGQGASTGSSTDQGAPVAVYLDAVQLQHASTINAVGLHRGLTQQARTIALATAFQESQLRNLPNGDRDSVGLFQQRPSQGWGTVRQISDPVYAAGKFFDALMKVPGWQRMSLTKAAQAVQYSGFPDAYAKWEGKALTLAAALGGEVPVELNCVAGARPSSADAPVRKAVPGTTAASPALAAVLAAAQAELGGLKVVSASGSTGTVTVTLTNLGAQQSARTLAAWAVAHSPGFSVSAVSAGSQQWADHSWTSAGTQLPAGQVVIRTA